MRSQRSLFKLQSDFNRLLICLEAAKVVNNRKVVAELFP